MQQGQRAHNTLTLALTSLPQVPIKDEVARFWRHGYYAAVSYVDSNIGKVLTALDDLGLADDTVVLMIADHGYQLGEHSMWEKYTNWELATRVPFIVAVPWKPESHGLVSTVRGVSRSI